MPLDLSRCQLSIDMLFDGQILNNHEAEMGLEVPLQKTRNPKYPNFDPSYLEKRRF